MLPCHWVDWCCGLTQNRYMGSLSTKSQYSLMFKDLSFLKRRLEGEAIYAGAGKPGEISDLVFYYTSWVPKSLWMATAVMKLKRHLLPGRKAMTSLDIIFFLKKQRHHFADKVPYSQSYGGFSNSYVRM